MSSFELTVTLFAAWWLIGLGLLAVLDADTSSLRRALTAPALGSGVTVLCLFVFSEAGMAIEHCAVPVTLTLLIGAVLALAVRRPRLPATALAVLAVCGVGLLVIAGPMRTFGFAWISNANDDMANYVLSAEQFLHHGLFAHFNISGLKHDRDYPTVMQDFHLDGSRPGADIMLAALSRITGRLPYEVFMPLIFSFTLCGACAAGALALQAARRWWAAVLAAALLLVSPEATFGALQQLLPQVWGLAVAAALFALLMRPELHRAPGAQLRDLIPIGLLATALILVYVELASTLFLAYVLYAAVLIGQRKTDWKSLVRLWAPAAIIIFIVLNGYLLRELKYVSVQAGGGLSQNPNLLGNVPTFGYSLVPLALPGILGLVQLPSGSGDLGDNFAIVLAAGVLVALFVAALINLRKGVAAAMVFVVYGLFGFLLLERSSDFGLFKLYMYAQPFLAALIAVLATRASGKLTTALACVPVGVLIVLALPVQNNYVEKSRDPIDLPSASSGQLLPTFKRFFATANAPVVSVTENPALGKIEGASIGERPLYFISADVFATLPTAYIKGLSATRTAEAERARKAATWPSRSFDLYDPDGPHEDDFQDNLIANGVLTSGNCQLVLPTGSEIAVNRFALPEGSPALIERSCRSAHDVLAFTSSNLGAGFYSLAPRKDKTFYQLESDPLDPGHTMSGVGRYLLFHVLGPLRGSRLEINLTVSYIHDSSNEVPPVSVVGKQRYPLPVVGRGSARVFSAPIEPQWIEGQPYVLVDLGKNGKVLYGNRTGIQGLYNRRVPLDPRYLSGYVRDISLVSPRQYEQLKPPLAVGGFPEGLANPNLQYSGIYEDGWVSKESYFVLAGGPAADLEVHGEVPLHAGGGLTISMNGKKLIFATAKPGVLDLRVPVKASSGNRRVELSFSNGIKLAPPDFRPASALLSFIGFVPQS